MGLVSNGWHPTYDVQCLPLSDMGWRQPYDIQCLPLSDVWFGVNYMTSRIYHCWTYGLVGVQRMTSSILRVVYSNGVRCMVMTYSVGCEVSDVFRTSDVKWFQCNTFNGSRHSLGSFVSCHRVSITTMSSASPNRAPKSGL
jgi:hypothetical protein